MLEVSHFKHPEPSLFIFIPGNAWEGISQSDAFSNFAQESLKEQQKAAEDLLCLEIKHLRGVSWQQGFSNQNIYNLPFIHHLPSGRTPKLFPGSRNHHQPPSARVGRGKIPFFRCFPTQSQLLGGFFPTDGEKMLCFGFSFLFYQSINLSQEINLILFNLA